MRANELLKEGWESGPDERAPRERDPDAGYDDMRQRKMDEPHQPKPTQYKSFQVVDLTTRQPVVDKLFATRGEAGAFIMTNHAKSKNWATRGIDPIAESTLKDPEDYTEKLKALLDLSKNKDVDQKAVQQRKLDLDKEAKRKGFKEAVDQSEYTDEADMVQNNLKTIIRVAEELSRVLDANEDMAEWAQEKIAVVKSMIVTVTDYVISQHEQGNVQHTDEEFELDEKTDPKLCRSGKRLGRSDYSSCVSQGLRAHTSKGKGHTDGHGHYLKGKKAKSTRYGGDVPDYS